MARVLACVLPGTQEHFLGQVFGVLLVADDGNEQGKDPRLVALHQHAERALLVAGD